MLKCVSFHTVEPAINPWPLFRLHRAEGWPQLWNNKVPVMVSPEAGCLNFVSPESVRRGQEWGKRQNFPCVLLSLKALKVKVEGMLLVETGWRPKGGQTVSESVLIVVRVVVEGTKGAEAWQTAKRIKYWSTTKAVSQGRLSHKSPSSTTPYL